METNINRIPYLSLHDLITHVHGKAYVQNKLRFPFDKNGVYVGTLETFQEQLHRLPHGYIQDFYQINAIRKGRISKIHQTDRIEILGDELFISKPGQMNTWNAAEGVKGYYLAFTRGFLHGINYKENMLTEFPFLSPLRPAHFDLAPEDYDNFGDTLERIYMAYEEKKRFAYELIRIWIMELLIKLLKYDSLTSPEQLDPCSSTEMSHRFIERLEQHFIEGLNQKHVRAKGVAEFAAELNTQPSRLNRHLKIALGKNVKTVISERYILAAKCKLIHTNFSVLEICYTLGYDNPSYFSRFFKKYTGMTPIEFRKKHQYT